MPRLAGYGEHVNDHQLGLAERFEKAGHILVAYCDDEVAVKGRRLGDFVPLPRQNSKEAVISRIEEFLKQICLSRENH
jgi:UDP-N-acetylglucosamine transferase subunit ALG13